MVGAPMKFQALWGKFIYYQKSKFLFSLESNFALTLLAFYSAESQWNAKNQIERTLLLLFFVIILSTLQESRRLNKSIKDMFWLLTNNR